MLLRVLLMMLATMVAGDVLSAGPGGEGGVVAHAADDQKQLVACALVPRLP